MEASASAAQSLAEFAKSLPRQGGMLDELIGSADIAGFGRQLPEFGRCFKLYNDSVHDIKPDIVTASANAAQSLAEFARAIPRQGGFIDTLFGSTDIAAFGAKLAEFGAKYRDYYLSIKDVIESKVTGSINSLKSLIECAVKIKDQVDTGKMDKFGESIKKLANNMNIFADSKKLEESFTNMLNNMIGKFESFGNKIRNAMTNLFENLGKSVKSISVDASGNLKFNQVPNVTIPRLAAGGVINAGQMFIAREAGPELVGNVGRRTAVMNNDQIVASVSQGVADANLEQNALLREEIGILRQILAKDSAHYNSRGGDFISSVERRNRRDGKTIIPIGI